MKDIKKEKKSFITPNKIILGVLVASIVMLSGLSYAWYKLSITGEKEITLTSGELSLTFNDVDSGVISLTNGEPLSDEEGMSTTGYTFSIKNNGSIDSSYNIYLDDINITDGKTRMNDSYVKYSIVKDGEVPTALSLSTNKAFTNTSGVLTRSINTDTISSGDTYNYTLKVWIADTADNGVMNTSFKAKLRIEATQVIPKTKVCRRATTLHTEECTQTSTSSYCSGAGYTATGSKGTTTITYGNLGTEGKLTAGDAFDCDVNGDGNYDHATERFYYVADQDSDTAVMIYYKNTAGGLPSNSTTFAYDAGRDAYTNGPTTAIAQIPTTSQWTNVSLKNTTRDLTDETGAVTTASFSYAGYAARLLTTQELGSACGITVGNYTAGELDSCNYIFENTRYSNKTLGSYGIWLENPYSGSSGGAWVMDVNDRYASSNDVGYADYCGVRPAIEVPKTDILY